VEFDGVALTIGAVATLNDIHHSGLVNEHFPALADVVGDIATRQVRNRATLGGNLCNAAPSADGVPILMVAGARVGIYSDGGEREVPLEKFFTGPGSTVLEPGEILTRIVVEEPSPEAHFAYVKHEVRKTLEIAIVGVAAALTVPAGGRCQDARVVVGACAPTPVRARSAEAILEGSALGEEDVRRAGEAAAEDIAPIDDVRGSAWYRREMTSVCLGRCVRKAMEEVRS
jgi:carbon-monoxide dehydrogenase medium subunit